jgi:alpha-glucosidase (family GH31 glycosyl hydrolase)
MVVGALTDLSRSWETLKNVVSMALSLSMYGVNNVLLDVCGNGVKNEELCARWA